MAGGAKKKQRWEEKINKYYKKLESDRDREIRKQQINEEKMQMKRGISGASTSASASASVSDTHTSVGYGSDAIGDVICGKTETDPRMSDHLRGKPPPTEWMLKKIKKWATRRWQENVVKVKSFEDLETPDPMNHVVRNPRWNAQLGSTNR